MADKKITVRVRRKHRSAPPVKADASPIKLAATVPPAAGSSLLPGLLNQLRMAHHV